MVPTPDILAQLQELRAELAAVKAENAWLKRQLFGPGKSEKLDRLQASLPLGEVPVVSVPAKVETIRYERVVAKEKRPLPSEAFKDVPVKETIVIEPEEVKADRAAYEQIGEERTFEIDVTAPQIYKREIVRPKYRHKTNRAQPPVVAPAPARAVQGGYASAGLLAWIALSKYVDHQPLYAALSAGEAVGSVGRGDPAPNHGRLDRDHGRMAEADLPVHAPPAAGGSVSASR